MRRNLQETSRSVVEQNRRRIANRSWEALANECIRCQARERELATVFR